MAKPLLLVDVDGVLSLFGPEVDRDDCVPALVEGIPHFLSRSAAATLAGLAPRFECVWCTGWEDRADAHLPHLVGLPRGWRHLVFSGRPGDTAHWKLAAIDAFAGRAPATGLDRRRPRRAAAAIGPPRGRARRCS